MTRHTPASIAKMKATRERNKKAKEAKARERLLKKQAKLAAALPLNVVSNGHDAEEFAKFMAAAWKVFKGQ